MEQPTLFPYSEQQKSITWEVYETQDQNGKADIYTGYRSGCTPKFRFYIEYCLWIRQGAK